MLSSFFNLVEEFGFLWLSEGELVVKFVKKYGNLKIVKIMNVY